jgi:uncharacterized membrane protein
VDTQVPRVSDDSTDVEPQAAAGDAIRPAAIASGAANVWRPRLRLIAVAALVIGYAALSHYSASSPEAKGLGAALSLAPVLLIAAILAWRWASPLVAAALAAAVGALLYRFWPVLENNFEWADLIQQFAVYGLIALGFLRSLRPDQTPLCTQLAGRLHGALTPEEIAYTRRATVAWAAFYALIACAVLALFFIASLRVWSLFVNFAVFGLIAFMCIADHAIRQRVLPRRPSGGLVAALRQSLIG